MWFRERVHLGSHKWLDSFLGIKLEAVELCNRESKTHNIMVVGIIYNCYFVHGHNTWLGEYVRSKRIKKEDVCLVISIISNNIKNMIITIIIVIMTAKNIIAPSLGF